MVYKYRVGISRKSGKLFKTLEQASNEMRRLQQSFISGKVSKPTRKFIYRVRSK